MKKMIVIGCPGSGKSTFARSLRDLTSIPLFYLDMLWHKPDQTTESIEVFEARLMQIVKQDHWIIDGTYLRTLQLRLKECDTVFFLDFPLETCLSGVASRIGKQREDMPWIETEFDEEFKQWILDFTKDQIPEIKRLLKNYQKDKKIVVFKSREELDEFLHVLGK